GAGFWSQFGGSSGSAIAALVADKWLKFPTTNAQFGALANIASSSIFDQLTTTHGTITNKGQTTFQGQSAVDIFDSKEKADLYVAATGTAYPVALAKTATGSAATITFDNWNQSVTLTAPSSFTDFSKLIGG